jgi:dCMP deaminase
MKAAYDYATLSHCQRKKVGCLIVTQDDVVFYGFNGTPTGFPNKCEDENGKTHPHVLHAEANAISKVAKSNSSSNGAALFVTIEPCLECAKLIAQAGVKEVYYSEEYSSTNRMWGGIEFLRSCGIQVKKLQV